MLSSYGLEFRHLMNVWDKQKLVEEINAKKEKIKTLLDAGPMILFLKHKENGDIFGADEPSRIVFSRMKNPGEEEPPEWADQANFMATHMGKLLSGGGGHHTIFSKKDLGKLDVMDDKDDLIDHLVKMMSGGGEGGKTKFVMKLGTATPDGEFGDDIQEK